MSNDSDKQQLEKLEVFNQEFFDLCEVRHNDGAKEYGDLNFLTVNLPEFIYEEMADISNYVRFMYIRLRLLEEMTRERGIDMSAAFVGEVRDEDEVPSGSSSFVPTSEVSGFLSDKK